jgi:predicted RNase H-like nuclease (RuvC/YqgF family)
VGERAAPARREGRLVSELWFGWELDRLNKEIERLNTELAAIKIENESLNQRIKAIQDIRDFHILELT